MANDLLTEDAVYLTTETAALVALESSDTGVRMTIRDQLVSGMRLPALVGSEIGIVASQWTNLGRGLDVTITADQLRSFVSADDWPLAIAAHDSWRLSGDDALAPA